MGNTARPRVLTFEVVRAVLARPALWVTAIRQVGRLAPTGWWKKRPFLPLPSAEYLEFRLVTQYGGGHGESLGTPRAHDVVAWLEWCRDFDRGAGSRARPGSGVR